MGKTSVLKKHHKEFLELVLKEPYLLKRFYWTGGTALAEFYLHHRESENIDLFFLAKTKFDWHIDPIQLGQTFIQVVAVKDVPDMLVPFDRKKMENFFLTQSKELQTDIFS